MSDTYDPATGIITLISSGFHSLEQVRDRSQMVGALIDVAKRDRGYVRILNFALDLPVQATEVTAASIKQADESDRLDHPKDRFAMVIASALARMQMARIIGSDKRRVFSTEAEARDWLLED